MNEWILPEINLSLCTSCGTCVAVCPESAVRMTEQGPVFSQPQRCSYCAVCEEICPAGAIRCTFEVTWDEQQKG